MPKFIYTVQYSLSNDNASTIEEELTEKEVELEVNLMRVKVGSRLSILWEDDNTFYEATVAKLHSTSSSSSETAAAAATMMKSSGNSRGSKKRSGSKCWCVYYDFGGREWIDLSEHQFQILSSDGSAAVASTDARPTDESLASAPPTPASKAGNIASSRSPSCRINTTVTVKRAPPPLPELHKRGDGKSGVAAAAADDTNHNDKKDAARPAFATTSDICVGSRVSIYWPEDRAYYQANVVRMGTNGSDASYFLEFDDGVRDWMDLSGLHCQVIASDDDEGTSDDKELEDEELHEPEPESQRQRERMEPDDKSMHVESQHQGSPSDGRDDLLLDDKASSVSLDDDEEKEGPAPEPRRERVREKSMSVESLQDAGSRGPILEGKVATTSSARQVEPVQKDDIMDIGKKEDGRVEDSTPSIAMEEDVTSSKMEVENNSGQASVGEDIIKVGAESTPEQLGDADLVEDTHDNDLASHQSSHDDNNDDDDEASYASEHDEPEPSPDTDVLIVGSRVGVWWPDDYTYYHAKVVDYRDSKRKPSWYIEYDDGESEWINFKEHSFKLLRASPAKRRVGDDQIRRQPSSNKSHRRGRHGFPVEKVDPQTGEVLETFASISVVVEGSGGSIKRKEIDRVLQVNDRSNRPELLAGYYWRLARTHDASSPRKPLQVPHSNSTVSQSPREKQIAKVVVGTRVGVWWDDDECYYNGICMRYDEHREKSWRLLYDDGEREWIDLRKHGFRILTNEGPHDGSNDRKQRAMLAHNKQRSDESSSCDEDESSTTTASTDEERSISKVVLGSRVSIWWGGDKQYFDGTIAAVDSERTRFFIEYDVSVPSSASIFDGRYIPNEFCFFYRISFIGWRRGMG